MFIRKRRLTSRYYYFLFVRLLIWNSISTIRRGRSLLVSIVFYGRWNVIIVCLAISCWSLDVRKGTRWRCDHRAGWRGIDPRGAAVGLAVQFTGHNRGSWNSSRNGITPSVRVPVKAPWPLGRILFHFDVGSRRMVGQYRRWSRRSLADRDVFRLDCRVRATVGCGRRLVHRQEVRSDQIAYSFGTASTTNLKESNNKLFYLKIPIFWPDSQEVNNVPFRMILRIALTLQVKW